MAISNWLCNNNSKSMLLRIVHPGGHVELHERPILAGEIMCRNPRCCVAYTHVFQQPWAIVAQDAMLMPGQKYYVVPISSIKKLQRLSPRNSPSPAREFKKFSPPPPPSSSVREIRNIQSSSKYEEDDEKKITTCWFFKNSRETRTNNAKDENDCFSDNMCFLGLFSGVTVEASVNNMTNEETKTTSSRSENNPMTRKRTQDLTGNGTRGSSPRRLCMSSDHWQPGLESITEE